MSEHPFQHRIEARLAALAQRGLRRSLRAARAGDGPRLQQDGQAVLGFASNDYLGLRQDARVIAAFKRAADRYGVGAGAAHLLGGHTVEHAELERELADWLGREAVLLFSSGWQAALGTIGALLARHDRLYQDRLNHACLLDAALQARVRAQRYPHGDVAELRRLLAESSAHPALVLSDSLFSMDGDLAPLPALAAACAEHQAWLMLDEAHALGVLGPQGAGALAAAGVDPAQAQILLGTFGKALGGAGAFIAGSQALREYLVNQARTFVYTTAMPPAMAAAMREAVRIARHEQWRRERLVALATQLRTGLRQLGYVLVDGAAGPIQPVLLGEPEVAVEASQALQQAGFLVPAIRPPTVPEHGARLRISLSAAHSAADVDGLLQAFEQLRGRAPLLRGAAPLYCERHGAHGPDLVLLHGWGMHGAIFAALVAELAPFCRLHVFDLPGHGHSHGSPLPLDASHVIDAVRAVVPRAHWFGWSLGGLIALQAALDAPEAVLSLNLCGASACFVQTPAFPHGMPAQVFESFAADLAQDWQGTLQRFLVLETLGAAEPAHELRTLKALAAQRAAPRLEALQQGLRLLSDLDLSGRLDELQRPSLWIGGQRDRLVSPAALQAQVQRLAGQGARLELVERAGHAPFLREPARIAALLRNRLTELGALP